MSIVDLIEVIKKKWLIMLIWIMVLAGVALLVTWQLPQTYEAGGTATIVGASETDQSKVNYYLYDNYYAIQSGAFLADNVVSWLSSPTVVADIYKNAEISLPDKNLRALGKTFEAKKLSANSNVVAFKTIDTNANTAEKMLKSADKELDGLVANINKEQKGASTRYSIYFTDPVVIKAPKSYTINGIAGALIGVLIAIAIALYPNKKHAIK